MKRRLHVRGPASLSSEAGHEQPGVRHRGPQLVELRGPGGAHHRAHRAVAAAGSRPHRELFHARGHMLVDRLAIAPQVLEVLAAGVRGFHEHEYARASRLGRLHEGLDRVESEVGVHGEGVGCPRAGEPAVGIGLGGGADVAPLAIGEHEELLRPRVLDHLGECRHAVGAEGLEAGELRLHDRHQRRDDVDHVAAEAGEDAGERFGFERRGRGQRRRQRLPPRVEADAGGRAAGGDGGGEAGGKAGHRTCSREDRGGPRWPSPHKCVDRGGDWRGAAGNRRIIVFPQVAGMSGRRSRRVHAGRREP